MTSALNLALAQASNSEKFATGAEQPGSAIQSGRRDEAMRIIEMLRAETAKRRKIVQDGYSNRGELPDKL
ncbi:MAG: hypothetical protein DU429_01380 [Candidatus Tokpelaia sp.]|nr:MAG: hypothetical protein DU430_03010 [Candidatus Tokpelaia sp.]KAA6207713.1 MAG: hypothetical protein DU429_01380 [Candidatus Tokpelaia sp.]